jgi:hypothetical protein
VTGGWDKRGKEGRVAARVVAGIKGEGFLEE